MYVTHETSSALWCLGYVTALWLVAALVLSADDALSRGAAARSLTPIPVPVDEANRCFVPQRMSGQRCAEGFRLCRDVMGHGSCDGYGQETVTLRVEYEGEPEPTSSGPNGLRPGMPLSFEAGYSLELESMSCHASMRVYGVMMRPGATLEERAVAEERARLAAKKENDEVVAKCVEEARVRLAKNRRWQRCTLLSVDACRREAFLDCKGNSGERGLVRASWSRPGDAPASETMKIKVLSR